MATTRKTTKKSSPRKASKATSAKKAPVKKHSVKKSSTKKVQMRSFHIAPEEKSFNTFQITRQTVYWVILVAFILFAQLWILKLQIDVATLLDIQQQQLMSN